MKKILPLFLLALAACGTPITRQAELQQPPGKELLAGVGDVMLRIERTKCLPNAFGSCDIFGRTSSEGFVEVRFMGVERSGEVVLARKDLSIVSNESTMTRTPASFAAASAQTYGNTATAQGVRVGPLPDYHVVVPSDAIVIRLQPGGQAIVEGHAVKVLEAGPGSVRYSITKL